MSNESVVQQARVQIRLLLYNHEAQMVCQAAIDKCQATARVNRVAYYTALGKRLEHTRTKLEARLEELARSLTPKERKTLGIINLSQHEHTGGVCYDRYKSKWQRD